MKLILGGGGSAEDEAANVDHLARLLDGGRLLCLPLALEDPGDPRFASWIRATFEPRGIRDISICASVERARALDLSDFAGLFLGGGNTYLLLQRLRKWELVEAIRRAAASGLPIYGGSAGAIVLGAHIETCAHMDENRIGLRDLSGLDLCDGHAVWCHYAPRDQDGIEALCKRRTEPVLSIPEDGGVLVEDAGLHSLGSATVLRWIASGTHPIPTLASADRWRKTWAHIGREPPAELLDELVRAYGEAHRAYHTLEHLEECFAHLDAYPGVPVAPGLLELALWFHDAVYDTRAADNEEASAAWARSSLRDLPTSDVAIIERLVLVTKHDATPRSPDEELLLDIDLSILGAPERRFAEYEKQIRAEYRWVPIEDYRSGRSRILAGFRARPALYHTAHFRSALEERARANLARSLAALLGGGP